MPSSSQLVLLLLMLTLAAQLHVLSLHYTLRTMEVVFWAMVCPLGLSCSQQQVQLQLQVSLQSSCSV
jgi:hypothetical protein